MACRSPSPRKKTLPASSLQPLAPSLEPLLLFPRKRLCEAVTRAYAKVIVDSNAVDIRELRELQKTQ